MKYAPPNKVGEKPYVVEFMDWGREYSRLVFAKDATDARWKVMGRPSVGRYHRKTRRARPDDVAAEATT